MINRSVLSDQVKDYLLKAILTGEFGPGSRIVETRVARDLGISQGPVREALRDLEALGVIDSTPYQGARVRQPSKVELLEAYDVRAELEVLGARLALGRLEEADLLELDTYVVQMRRAARARDPEEQARADVAFHARIIELSGNHTLQRVWRYLEPMARTHITFVLPGLNSNRIIDLHRPIVDALRDRDSASAQRALHDHFRITGAMFEQLFPEPASGAAEFDAAVGAAMP